MKIEPLQTLLSFTTNKHQTLLIYLSDKIKEQIQNAEYTTKDYYLNDKIFCIRKDNLELEMSGTIIQIDDDTIGIKISSVRNQFISTDDYYTFVQAKKQVKTQRQLMEQLMNQLQKK